MFKTLLTKKTPGLDGFPSRLYLMLKEEMMSVLHKFFQRRAEDETPHLPLILAKIILVPKPGKGSSRTENFMPISFMNKDAKTLHKILKS